MTRLRNAALTLAVATLAAGCASAPGTACDGWRPIRPLKDDLATMSDTLVGQVLAHNEFGARLCGWKP
jgi:hypothetical protein